MTKRKHKIKDEDGEEENGDVQTQEPLIKEKKKKHKHKHKHQNQNDESQAEMETIPDYEIDHYNEKEHKKKKKKKKHKHKHDRDEPEPEPDFQTIQEEDQEQIDDNLTEETYVKKKKKKKKHKNSDQETTDETDSQVKEQMYEYLDNRETNLNELPSIRPEYVLDTSLVSDEQLHLLIPKLTRLNDQDINMLQEQNIFVNKGRFSSRENEILLRNWQRYQEDYNVPNKNFLFGHFQYLANSDHEKTLKKSYQKFAKETQLLLRLAKDLPNRTIFQIYCRARQLLSGLKMAKEFNEQDRQIILDLYRKHGECYSKFCEQFGYNPKCAREVIRNQLKANGEQIKRGEWTVEEIEKLKKYVKKYVRKHNLQSYDGISWTKIAAKLQRSDIQCRQRFFSKSILMKTNGENNNNENGCDNDWNNRLDLAKFIALLKHLNYQDEYQIDWDYIREKFENYNFFNILLRKWREIRLRVPNHQELSLPEIVDFLYKKRVLKYFEDDDEKMNEIQSFIQEDSY